MSFPKFNILTLELQQMIVQSVDAHDLIHLAQASSYMHFLAIPAIYHTVDISIHYDREKIRDFVVVEEETPYRQAATLRRLFYRQKSFHQTLKIHPEYAKCVRSLIWSYYMLGLQEVREMYFQEGVGEDPMWKSFQRMERLQSIDFHSLVPVSRGYPPLLDLRNVKDVRLSGRMAPVVARTFVKSFDLSRLISIELDSSLELERQILHSPRDGLMAGSVSYLTGNCTRLRHLTLKSLGQGWVTTRLLWSEKKDEIRYQEWAKFINSVRPTLKTFKFDQFAEDRSLPTDEDFMILAGRPMDRRFGNYILPCLLRGPWPELFKFTLVETGGMACPWASWTDPDYSELGMPGICNQVAQARSRAKGMIVSWERQSDSNVLSEVYRLRDSYL